MTVEQPMVETVARRRRKSASGMIPVIKPRALLQAMPLEPNRPALPRRLRRHPLPYRVRRSWSVESLGGRVRPSGILGTGRAVTLRFGRVCPVLQILQVLLQVLQVLPVLQILLVLLVVARLLMTPVTVRRIGKRQQEEMPGLGRQVLRLLGRMPNLLQRLLQPGQVEQKDNRKRQRDLRRNENSSSSRSRGRHRLSLAGRSSMLKLQGA
mmetsp:Transcript_6971/g.13633  ORF Transcript_6971/g.13633 Transcript_6971/m.13633 type:complete len:210 (-) Transcript_6971:88-717(-)